MSKKNDWIEAAKVELNGKNPEETLSKDWQGFTISPYYDASETQLKTEKAAVRQGNKFGGPNGWINLPIINQLSDNQVNEKALNYLQQGADGVAFTISDTVSISILNDIKTEFCFLGFETQQPSLNFFQALAKQVPAQKLNGVIFWNAEADWLAIANIFKGYENFRCFGVTTVGETVEDKLLNGFITVLHLLDKLTDYGFMARNIFNQLAMSYQSTPNFFMDACAIRAIRILMQRLALAYGLNEVTSFIRLQSNPVVPEAYQPHGEMLQNTLAGLAAVAASADAVSINTENPNSELHVRTARNISLLLKEESKLDKVIDPLAGSYFIESLTNELVDNVWNKLVKV